MGNIIEFKEIEKQDSQDFVQEGKKRYSVVFQSILTITVEMNGDTEEAVRDAAIEKFKSEGMMPGIFSQTKYIVARIEEVKSEQVAER